MTTYSVGATGLVPGQSTNKNYDIPDASLGSFSCTPNNGASGMANTMRQGDVMLAKGPDGSTFLARFDPERSTPTNPVLVRV